MSESKNAGWIYSRFLWHIDGKLLSDYSKWNHSIPPWIHSPDYFESLIQILLISNSDMVNLRLCILFRKRKKKKLFVFCNSPIHWEIYVWFLSIPYNCSNIFLENRKVFQNFPLRKHVIGGFESMQQCKVIHSSAIAVDL